LAGGLAASDARAASIVYNSNNTDWALGTSWAGGVVPGPADIAFVRNNQTAIISSAVPNISALTLGEAGANGTVSLQPGGSLTVTGDAQVMRRGTLAGALGTITLTGGSLTVGGTMFVGNGSTNTANGIGTINLSGSSTLNSGATLGSSTQALGSGNFNVNGSLLTVGDGGVSKPFIVNDFGTVRFNLDAAGPSTLNYAASAVTLNTGAELIVDGTNYTGTGGVFTLINGLSLVGTEATVDESVTGFAPGYTASISFDSGNGDVLLTIVPEPASAAALAAGGLLFASARRRRR
jgi:hypothetical protein